METKTVAQPTNAIAGKQLSKVRTACVVNWAKHVSVSAEHTEEK